jgi:hypothetical protein
MNRINATTEHDVQTGPTPDRDICRMGPETLLAVLEESARLAMTMPFGLSEQQQAFRDTCRTEALARMRRGGEATRS